MSAFLSSLPYSPASYLNSSVFAVTFVIVAYFSGLFTPLLIAFITAAAATAGYRYAFNQRLPVSKSQAILITGCSTGIGLDAVIHLSGLGYSVFAGCRNQSDFTMLQQLNSNVTPVILDVTKQSDIDAALQTITQQLSNNKQHLVALVNNAGYGEFGPTELISPAALQRQFAINVHGPIAVIQSFLPLLRTAGSRNRSSRIVNITSVAGRVTFSNNGAYCASKYALESLSDALRQELKSFGVDVILIEPGFIRTAFQAVALNTAATTSAGIDALVAAGSSSDNSISRVEPAVLSHYKQAVDKLVSMFARVPMSSPRVVTEQIHAAVADSLPAPRLFAGVDAQMTFMYGMVPDQIFDLVAGNAFK